MNFVLLLGAGFTRNWGGWLALEAFEYLLGCPEVDDDLQKLLWDYKDRGGFEAALAELQKHHVQSHQIGVCGSRSDGPCGAAAASHDTTGKALALVDPDFVFGQLRQIEVFAEVPEQRICS